MNTPDAAKRPQNAEAEEADWREVVERIRSGEDSGLEELYRVFANGVRFHLYRRFGSQDLDDKVHDIFVMVVKAIHDGEVRDPDRLMGYVRTVVRRQVAGYIENAARSRRKQIGLDPEMALSDRAPDPERRAIERESVGIAMRVLNGISKRDREVLIRFYLEEQPVQEICSDLGLNETQFRLIKSRAKARFGALGKSRIQRILRRW